MEKISKIKQEIQPDNWVLTGYGYFEWQKHFFAPDGEIPHYIEAIATRMWLQRAQEATENYYQHWNEEQGEFRCRITYKNGIGNTLCVYPRTKRAVFYLTS